MRRADFVTIRKRNGKTAEVQPAEDCPRCGDRVQPVLIRTDPKKMYFVFDEGERGAMHHCLQFPDVVPRVR